MPEFQTNCTVIQVEHLGADIFRLTLEAPDIAEVVRPAQFVMVSCGTDQDPLLRRPFSVHGKQAGGCIQLLFKIVGRGTALLAQTRVGQDLSLVGPLGRAFRPPPPTGEVCLVGGGLGIAPLFFLAQWLLEQGTTPLVLLGAGSAVELSQLRQDFHELGCSVHLSTDDGSLGHHGLVTELLPALSDKVGKLYACGPVPMMAAVARFCGDRIACEVSLETHMACGLGACLGCAIPVPGRSDAYWHVCKHGPVFDAAEVVWP
jgi:dihydroorotate dehydrogenase electron transfer subunit